MLTNVGPVDFKKLQTLFARETNSWIMNASIKALKGFTRNLKGSE